MAQKVQVLLVDDIDGGEAAETVSFALDGVNYEIDLSDEHASALRDAFAPWVGHARRVGARTGGRRGSGSSSSTSSSSSSSRASKSSDGPSRDTGAVRAWAKENGYTVSERGRISSEVLEAYDAAH
ncbi:histone-like nucleoid-structuring protein Lsr2 [Kineococcus sp. SYSU DK004]|uniref:histone-like nucleoid-structuring protein Lsr2 n=1 Tax=Kineococcus sp. SYSU DK004 TaxID=3383125 RepID=UPI003D7C44DB